MPMSFLKELEKQNNITVTNNGETTYKSTLNSLLDLSTSIGNSRFEDDEVIVNKIVDSFKEDKVLTSKLIAYARDIREGGGDKSLGRLGFALLLLDIKKEKVSVLLDIVREYGSYKDLVYMLNENVDETSPENVKELVKHMNAKLEEDRLSEKPSLLAKYMPTETSKNKYVKSAYRTFMKYSSISPKEYRKRNTFIRKRLDILETKLTERKYSDIDYSAIPSQAGMKYRQAFFRNDEERYSEYLDEVNKGESKINTGTLDPYQIVSKIGFWGNKDKSLINMWNNLERPDNKGLNVLPVVDVSGSMMGLPMDVAISLGLLLSESNEGEFKDHFITFSERPTIEKVEGKDIFDKVRNMADSNWGFNTNLEKVFNLVLDTAVKTESSQEDIPEAIIIFSDMEMDVATGNQSLTFFDKMKEKYESKGYKLPFLVFWNIGYGNSTPVVENTKNTILVSGFSKNVFNTIFNLDFNELNNYTPLNALLETLNSDRYKVIEDLY